MSTYQSKIRIRAELLVYGFIRIYFSNDQTVPKELKDLCLLMYLITMDVWNTSKSHTDVMINTEDNTATFPATHGWKRAVGSMSIKIGEIQTWKIKITKECNLLIGITNSQSLDDGGSFFVKDRDSFGIHSKSGHKWATQHGISGRSYAEPFDKMDIVSITLDLTKEGKHGKVSYKRNDKDFGNAFNVNKNVSYCLIVSGFSQGQIQLLKGE